MCHPTLFPCSHLTLLGKVMIAALSMGTLRAVKMVAAASPDPALSSDIQPYAYQQGKVHSLGNKLDEQQGVTVVLLYREGCPYCVAFMPDFKKLAHTYRPQGVSFGSIRFSDDPSIRSVEKEEIAQLHDIPLRTFPCLVIFKDGKKVHVIQGDARARALPHLEATLDKLLYT